MLASTRPVPTGARKLTRTRAPDDFSQMRGARDEDLDPRAIRQIIGESDALAIEALDHPQVDCLSPVIREVKASGTVQRGASGGWLCALYGIAASGTTETGAAQQWIACAKTYLKPKAVA